MNIIGIYCNIGMRINNYIQEYIVSNTVSLGLGIVIGSAVTTGIGLGVYTYYMIASPFIRDILVPIVKQAESQAGHYFNHFKKLVGGVYSD